MSGYPPGLEASPHGDALLRPGKDYELRGSEIVEATGKDFHLISDDRVEELEARIAELEEALRPFADQAHEGRDYERARKVLDHE